MRALVLLAAALTVVGCAETAYDIGEAAQSGRQTSGDAAAMPAAVEGRAGSNGAKIRFAGRGEGDDGGVALRRKIIYTAQVNLVVEDFIGADARLRALVAEFAGYLAEYREDRTQGERLAGRWVVRVPVDRYEPFLAQVIALGVPEEQQSNAQDVTEEFVDLEARLTNKKKLEERVLELLAKRTGEIKDVLAVETELSRIREGIERIEGRLRYLQDHTAFSTVTITAREERDYEPPRSPSFVDRVVTTWEGSLGAMRATGENIAVAGVAAAPWAAVLVVFLSPLEWFRRRKRRPGN